MTRRVSLDTEYEVILLSGPCSPVQWLVRPCTFRPDITTCSQIPPTRLTIYHALFRVLDMGNTALAGVLTALTCSPSSSTGLLVLFAVVMYTCGNGRRPAKAQEYSIVIIVG